MQKEGKGACLVLHIPASRNAVIGSTSSAPTLASEPEPVQGTPARPDDGPFKPWIPKVLFMDDEPDIRTVVDKILTAHDVDITCTGSGEEAIDAYYQAIEENAPYDILLLDLEVAGGMGGKDTIAILRQDFPNIKAVVTTGYLDDVVLTNHREHGFSGVLTKPFQMEDLIKVINVLGGSRS